MASTYSKLKIELIGTGEQTGTWGTTTNNNLGSSSAGVYQGLEQAIVGMATLETADFTANSYTLPYNDDNSAQDFRALVLNITATLSGAGTVIVPTMQKPYIVMNNSSGGYAVTVKTALGTGISVPNGKTMWVYNNGTDVVTAIDNLPSGATVGGSSIGTVTSVAVSGGTTGLTTSGGPITTSGTVTLAGTLAAANGGTGRTSLTSNNVILGAGTSAVGFVAPGTSGNVLTSNGTTWVSSAPAGGGGGAITQSLTFTKSAGQTFSTSSEVSVSSWSATPSITISSASNRARATLYIPLYITATSGTTTAVIVRIKSGGTEYGVAYPLVDSQGGTWATTVTLIAELSASSGTKTFDVTLQNASANIQTEINLSSGPTYLILEEIAP